MEQVRRAMDFDGLRLERLAVVGDDGMVNITMSDPGEPCRWAVLVYDRESGEFFDAYLRDGGMHALSDAEARELLRSVNNHLKRYWRRQIL